MSKKALLVFPKNKLDKIPPLYPPLGIGYISEALTAAGIAHDILDMRLGHSFSDLEKKIKEFEPDFIGMTMMTFSYLENYEFLRKIKRLFPHIGIVVGGAHVSAIKEKILLACDAIDYAAYQEGEETFVELCTRPDARAVKGIFYRDRETNNTIFTGLRPINPDFNALPFPKFEKFELNKYITDKIAILTSRGCPYQCTYCAVGTSIGNAFRPKNPERVLEELRFWIERGYAKFDFIDDNFTLDPKRAKEICRLIKERYDSEVLIECSSGIRADRVDRDLLAAMKEAGFYALSIPVESASNKVLRAIKKSQDIGKIDETIKNACELGFDVTLFFLVGSPTETMDDVKQSVALARKYPVYDVCFHNLVPFPGTELYEWVETNHYFLIRPEEYLNRASLTSFEPYFQTPEFSRGDRVRALRETRKAKIKIQYRAYLAKYRTFGVFAPAAAYFTSITALQLFFAKSKPLRKLVNTILSHEKSSRHKQQT
jgi:radical SAM superfamily enzyme YgiQ (UPF0313 family)